MSDYQLGQRVRMTGTVEKQRDRVAWRPRNSNRIFSEAVGNWPAIKAMPGRATFGLLRTRLIANAAPEKPEGLIVGKRTIQQGITEHYSDGDPACFFRCENTPVYLVAFALHRNPVMCRDDQLSPIEEES